MFIMQFVSCFVTNFGGFLSFVFSTIPKTFGFEAATHFILIPSCGSLIPIAGIGMGMALP
jgi:hypothetical protein